MAKVNEQIEDMLDVQDDHEKRIKATEEQLPKLIELLDAVQKKLAEKPAAQPVQQVQPVAANVKVEYKDLKNAVYNGIADYYKAFPSMSGDLKDNDGKKIAAICKGEYSAAWKIHYDNQLVKKREEEEELAMLRSQQGLRTLEQVEEWAPEYPPEVRRAVLFLGKHVIDEEEEPETAHKLLKVWGDVLAGITRKPESPPPTLSAWLSYRWNKFKESTDKWGALKWGFLISLTCSIFICISLYQERVMDLDRTNRIFYRKVMQTEEGRKQYHELDSLIHADSFFKTYRTLDSE